VVAHPSEGVTTAGLLRDLSGGREPSKLPKTLPRSLVRSAKLLGRWHAPTAANARRMEMLWFGQRQAESWLTSSGFHPPAGSGAWKTLNTGDQS
jgi:hypothetical protein